MSERPFDLGPWRASPDRGVLALREGGREVRLEPQLMALLLLFAGSPGAVLGKDQIIAAVWGGRTIGDDTLAAAISRLRRALGERPGARFIETLPKRGYRLVPEAAGSANTASGAVEGAESDRLLGQGRALLRAGTPGGLPQARLYFEAAVRAEPRSGAAHAGLAESLIALHLAGQGPGASLLEAAQVAAHAAVGLDPDNPAAWVALGYTDLALDRDFARADQAFARALALAPGEVGALRARALALSAAGRFVEAERCSREAVARDPLSMTTRAGLLQVLLAARRYAAAIAEAKALIALSAQSADAWYALGWARVLRGETDEGADALLKGLSLWGVDAANIAVLHAAYADSGLAGLCAAGADLFEAQQVLFTPRPTDIAMLRALAGQPDQAFAALGAAAARRDPYLLLLAHLPWLDPLHDDPRWPALLERTRPLV